MIDYTLLALPTVLYWLTKISGYKTQFTGEKGETVSSPRTARKCSCYTTRLTGEKGETLYSFLHVVHGDSYTTQFTGEKGETRIDPCSTPHFPTFTSQASGAVLTPRPKGLRRTVQMIALCWTRAMLVHLSAGAL